jgi:hypothetical protein
MKKLYWILAAIAIVMLFSLGWRRGSAPQVDPPSKTVWKKDAPTSIHNDPVKIFQRAFWASPTSEDKILHAERREWSGPDGLQKWQWFLVVEPSPALLKRLRDDNAFGLIPAPSAIDIVNAPNWFQFKREEVSVLKSPQAKLQLIFSKDNHTLYATDSGLGFRAGAPEPFKPAPQAPILGRLPTTPPPSRPQP